MTTDPFETPRSAAHYYADKGWRVVPTDGTKKYPSRAAWQLLATTDHASIDAMFEDSRDQDICVAAGPGSGIFIVDIDPKSGGDESLQKLFDTYGVFPETPMVLTGGDGAHYYFKIPEGVDIRNEAGKSLGPGIDIRGDGGQVSAPPTLHVSGKKYEWEASSTPELVEVAEAPRWIIDLLESENKETAPRRERANRKEGEELPGDVWMDSMSWPDMLEEVGATYLYTGRDGEEYWARPPMDGEQDFRPHQGATLYYKGSDVLKLFTPNWIPLENGETYDKARFWVAYHADDYQGDTLEEKTSFFLAALSQEARNEEFAGFLEVQESAILADREAERLAAAEITREAVKRDTSWTPKPLTVARKDGPPKPPDHFYRTDDEPLLYKGRIHYFYGQPESGKSWAAQIAAVQIAGDGGTVLYLDFENDVHYFVERVDLLGLDPQHDDKIVFIEPDTKIDIKTPLKDIIEPVMKARCEAFGALLKVGYDLLVVDGVSNAMSVLGLDPRDHEGAVQFETKFLRPLANISHAAVVCIDHAPKSSGDGRPSIYGAQHKLAAVTGASFLFEPYEGEPFGRERSGRAKVSIMKDKPGYLRQLAVNGSHLGDLVIVSKDDKVERAEIVEPIDDDFVPVALMEAIALFVNKHQPVLESTVLNEVKGKHEWKKIALRKLLEGGFLDKDMTRQGKLYEKKPYAATAEGLVGQSPLFGPGPNVVQKERLKSEDPVDQAMAKSIGKANAWDKPTYTASFEELSRPVDRPRKTPEQIRERAAELEADPGFAQAATGKPVPLPDPPKPVPDVFQDHEPDVRAARQRLLNIGNLPQKLVDQFLAEDPTLVVPGRALPPIAEEPEPAACPVEALANNALANNPVNEEAPASAASGADEAGEDSPFSTKGMDSSAGEESPVATGKSWEDAWGMDG